MNSSKETTVRDLCRIYGIPIEEEEVEGLQDLYDLYGQGLEEIRALIEGYQPSDIAELEIFAQRGDLTESSMESGAPSHLTDVATWSSSHPSSALLVAQRLADAIDRGDVISNAFLRSCHVPDDGGQIDGPLSGALFAVKDNTNVAGSITTFGSGFSSPLRPSQDAALVARLRRGGAICIGKTNLSEAALSATNVHFGEVRNPWDLERDAGASSGGSASAVASGHVDFALGTDAGGSVRIPASWCGVVGFRPTGGSLSLSGIVGTPWTVDNHGIMARSVEDVTRIMSCSGWRVAQRGQLRARPRIAYLADESMGKVHDDVQQVYQQGIERLRNTEIDLEEISLPDYEVSAWIVLVSAYCEAGLQHKDWIRNRWSDYGEGVRQILRAGQLFTAQDYINAQLAKEVLRQRYLNQAKEFDAVVTPTVPVTATTLGQEAKVPGDDPKHALFTIMRFTNLFNVTGNPTITIPVGFDIDGLPVGLQLVGRKSQDLDLLETAFRLQTALDIKKTPSYFFDLSEYGRFENGA